MKTDTWYFSRNNTNWSEVHLPHTVFTEPENISHPQTGTAFYRYFFTAPEDWKEKIVTFEIGAAMQKAEIRVNGVYHFTHFGGYQKFFIPLSDDLKYGELNELHITLDNAPSRDMPPGKGVMDLDFCYHSGLYRSAAIRLWDPVHITDPLAVSIPAGGGVFLRTEKLVGTMATLTASCHVVHEIAASQRFGLCSDHEQPNQVQVRLEIWDPAGTCVYTGNADPVEIRPNCDHTFRFEPIEIQDAALWTPDTPNLYHARFTVFHDGAEKDVLTERFGIRINEFKPDGFYLNGVKTFMNGTNRHMEYPFIGNAVPPNAQRRDALLIKQSGYNMVRLSHYNQDPAFLDACDELGLMVLPAIPGWQAYHGNSAFLENAYRDCRELIRSLRNRPCVMFWEVSLNEAYPPAWVNAEFHRIAHEEYPGPYCFSAGDTWGFYEGWDVLFPCDHMRTKTKPVFTREYGDWAFGGSNSTSRRGRSASKKDLLVQTWNFLWTMNHLGTVAGSVGGADWCFIDYNRGYDSDIERSGSLDLYRLPKPKFYFYQSQRDPGRGVVLHAVHDEEDKLVVFSNCDEIEVRRKDCILARKDPDRGEDTPYGKSGSPGWETALQGGFDTTGGDPFNGGNGRNLAHPPFTFTGIEPLMDNGDVLIITAYRNGNAIAETKLVRASDPVSVKTRVRTEGVEPVVNDLVFVDAILQDPAGNIPEVSRKVRLTADGTAEIIGGMEQTEAGIASWLVRITGGEYRFRAEMIN